MAQIPKEIAFAHGSSSATVSGVVGEPNVDNYVVRGKMGQLLTVSITSSDSNARFSLSHDMMPDDPHAAAGGFVAMNEDGASLTEWGADWPYANAVQIVVGVERASAVYDLTVSITGTPI